MNLRLFASKIKKRYAKMSEPKKYVIDLIRFIIEYGLVWNIVLFVLFGFKLSPINVCGLGLAWYVVRYEVPKLVKEYKRSWVGD